MTNSFRAQTLNDYVYYIAVKVVGNQRVKGIMTTSVCRGKKVCLQTKKFDNQSTNINRYKVGVTVAEFPCVRRALLGHFAQIPIKTSKSSREFSHSPLLCQIKADSNGLGEE